MSRSIRLKSGRRSAFTLLEMLAAVALVGLVAVSIFASLRIAMKAKTSSETAVEPSRSSDLVAEVVRQDLENAVPPTGVLAGAFTGADFLDDRGRDADTMLFFTTTPAALHVSGDGEIRRIEYVVLSPDGPNGEHLLVRRVIHNLLSPQTPASDDEVVCRGVGAFNLRFYDGTSFVDAWDSSQYNNSLPAVVEITIELDRPSGSNDNPNPVSHKYVRYVQVPCAVAQPSTGSGLGGGF